MSVYEDEDYDDVSQSIKSKTRAIFFPVVSFICFFSLTIVNENNRFEILLLLFPQTVLSKLDLFTGRFRSPN